MQYGTYWDKIIQIGDFGEIAQLPSYTIFWKIALTSSQSGIIHKYLTYLNSYITRSLQVKIFPKVYLKLELLVNKKIDTYGSIVKILATWLI